MTKQELKAAAILECVGRLGALKFFPSEEYARRAIMDEIDSFAENAEQVQWLFRYVLSHCNEWEGPQSLRAMFCMRFKPADGIDANLPLGHPVMVEAEQRAIAKHDEVRLLGAGEGLPLLKRLVGAKLQ